MLEALEISPPSLLDRLSIRPDRPLNGAVKTLDRPDHAPLMASTTPLAKLFALSTRLSQMPCTVSLNPPHRELASHLRSDHAFCTPVTTPCAAVDMPVLMASHFSDSHTRSSSALALMLSQLDTSQTPAAIIAPMPAATAAATPMIGSIPAEAIAEAAPTATIVVAATVSTPPSTPAAVTIACSTPGCSPNHSSAACAFSATTSSAGAAPSIRVVLSCVHTVDNGSRISPRRACASCASHVASLASMRLPAVTSYWSAASP